MKTELKGWLADNTVIVASFFAGYHIVVLLNLNVTEPHI